jgi:hypothetical protein
MTQTINTLLTELKDKATKLFEELDEVEKQIHFLEKYENESPVKVPTAPLTLDSCVKDDHEKIKNSESISSIPLNICVGHYKEPKSSVEEFIARQEIIKNFPKVFPSTYGREAAILLREKIYEFLYLSSHPGRLKDFEIYFKKKKYKFPYKSIKSNLSWAIREMIITDKNIEKIIIGNQNPKYRLKNKE